MFPGRAHIIWGLIKRFGDYDITLFSHRLIVQKLVYMLGEMGFILMYPSNWYLRGPYSPSLTKDLYSLTAEERSSIKPREFTDAKNEEQFKKFIEMIGNKRYDARWIELVGSLVYSVKQDKLGKETAIERVCTQKNFSDNECQKAWKLLEGIGLIE